MKPLDSVTFPVPSMPRFPHTTPPRQLLTAASWGAGIVLLIPLIALGGLLAVLLGAGTAMVRAVDTRAPRRRGPASAPARAARTPALRLPAVPADLGPAIAERHAA
jgi:hypothetical protein